MEMHSQELGLLLEALAKAQAIMQGAIEDSANPFFKSSYADLRSVWQACREPLTKNGLSVVQTLQHIEGHAYLVSILGHSSGQWIKSTMAITPAKNDVQAFGSAVTYARRYSLASLVGVCPADDDGESAMCRNKHKQEEYSQASIAFELPPDVSRQLLDKFINQSAKTSNKSVSFVITKANTNPEAFLEAFKKWENKNSDVV